MNSEVDGDPTQTSKLSDQEREHQGRGQMSGLPEQERGHHKRDQKRDQESELHIYHAPDQRHGQTSELHIYHVPNHQERGHHARGHHARRQESELPDQERGHHARDQESAQKPADQESDIYDTIFAKIITLLTHPRVLTFLRTSCRFLFSMVSVCVVIILARAEWSNVQTLRALYVIVTVMLLLHIVFNGYYMLLLVHHYPRIRHYLRSRARFSLFGARIAQALFALALMIAILAVEVFTIPQL